MTATAKHGHSVSDDCTEACPVFNPDGWRCAWCKRQRPMAADTEDWSAGPVCDECFIAEVP